MSTSVRISVDEFDDMIARGDFLPREEHRVELIRGEIVPIDPRGPMSPINPPHDDTVVELIEWSTQSLPLGVIRLRVQGSMNIPELGSQPQPDLLWMVPKRYSKERPSPNDILLLIEVSDATLAKDRRSKLELYAEAGIRDYWIINIQARCVEVYRDPRGLNYRDVKVYGLGQDVHPLAFPDVSLSVSRLFPE